MKYVYNKLIVKSSIDHLISCFADRFSLLLLERSKLDIPLRESLRIVRDCIDIDSPLADTEIATKLEEVSEET